MSPQPTPISEAEPWWRIGIAPDEARQPKEAIVRQDGYTRVIVEFDDQGCVYEVSQMQSLISELDRISGQRRAVDCVQSASVPAHGGLAYPAAEPGCPWSSAAHPRP